MNNELYIYVIKNKGYISTKSPVWNEQKQCFSHAKNCKIFSMNGKYGIINLMIMCGCNSKFISRTYVSINEFNTNVVFMGSLKEYIGNYK